MFPLKSLLNFSAIRFGLVGIANTLFGLSMIYSAKLVGLGDISANLFGYCCGLLLSFRLNSRWTFRFQGKLAPAFFIFCAVILASYLLNLAVVMTTIRIFKINSYLAQAIGIVPYTITSYLGCRFLVFKPKNFYPATTDSSVSKI